jgi:cell division protease FtsH
MADMEEAATKVKLGPEKKRLQSDLDKKITAYHEGGHAIVTHFQPDSDPVHRISIVSRGMSLGHTLIPPSQDRLHQTKTRLLGMITSMLGGRAAEEEVFNEVTTGASNDFDQATSIARAMVVDYGMSDLGPINYGPSQDITNWGGYYGQNNVSEETMHKIDMEIQKIIQMCYKDAIALIKKNREKLDKVAEALMKTESLDEDEFVAIVGKHV